MNLPFRKQGGIPNNPIIPEMNGPMPQSSVSNRGRVMQWVRIAILVIIALAILWLLFLGGRWAVRKVSHHSSTPSISTKSDTNNAKNTPAGNSPTPSTSQGSGQSNPSAPSPTTPTPKPSNTTPTNTLTNTGPGSTAALFLVTTTAGVVCYQIVLRRRSE